MLALTATVFIHLYLPHIWLQNAADELYRLSTLLITLDVTRCHSMLHVPFGTPCLRHAVALCYLLDAPLPLTLTSVHLAILVLLFIIPELLESETSEKTLETVHQTIPLEDQMIEAIHVDATKAEQKVLYDHSKTKGSLGARGHVYELLSSSQIVRGQIKAQTCVYPPKFSTTPGSPEVSIQTYGLRLAGVFPHPRNVIMKFVIALKEDYWLQVRL